MYDPGMAAIPTLAEIDETLIQYADTLSAEAISVKIGSALTPTQVHKRIKVLLDSPDWLTATYEDRLVTMKMRQQIAKMEELPTTARNAEVILAGLERIGNRLDKRMAATDSDLSKLYAFQGQAFLEAVNIAVAHMRGQLTSLDHAPSEAEWDAAMESGLRYAQLDLAKHEDGGEAEREQDAESTEVVPVARLAS